MTEVLTYEIVIRGLVSERLLGVLRDDFAVVHDDAGTTRLLGPVRDAAHLHGVVTQLTSFAIEIVSLGPVVIDHPTTNQQPANRKAHHDHHH